MQKLVDMNVKADRTTDKLIVGNYCIHINESLSTGQSFYLPDCADQFKDNEGNHKSEWTILYDILPEKESPVTNAIPIAGFYSGPFPYQVSRMENGDIQWIRGKRDSEERLIYHISRDWSHWKLVEDNTKDNGNNSFNELAYIFGYSILNKGGVLFHGAVMEWQGVGIIISAYSGVGKTTHARMWRDYEDALILNGDRALCCKVEDQWYTYGAPWCGTSGEHIQRRVKLKAIVFLERASWNEAYHLSKIEGAKELLKHIFVPDWDTECINNALEGIDHIVQNIPILRLQCTADREAVEVLKKELIML